MDCRTIILVIVNLMPRKGVHLSKRPYVNVIVSCCVPVSIPICARLSWHVDGGQLVYKVLI